MKPLSGAGAAPGRPGTHSAAEETGVSRIWVFARIAGEAVGVARAVRSSVTSPAFDTVTARAAGAPGPTVSASRRADAAPSTRSSAVPAEIVAPPSSARALSSA